MLFRSPKVPVKVAVGLVLSEKLPPAPLMIVQVPVPIAGVLAASVAVVTPQRLVWSGPAAAVVGVGVIVIPLVAVTNAQPPEAAIVLVTV